MSNLSITAVVNGFVVQEEGQHSSHRVAGFSAIHVFSNPQDMGGWVEKYYVDLERKREAESQQREDHNE